MVTDDPDVLHSPLQCLRQIYIDSQVNSALRRSSSLSGLNAAISFKIKSGRMQVEETHRSWKDIRSTQFHTEIERRIWFQIRICLRTGYKSRDINRRAKRNLFEYLCASFSPFKSVLWRRKTDNKAQKQSESPVVVSMGNVSPETVIVERYHQAENLVFLAPKQYEKIWMSISSDLDRIQATIDNQCSVMLLSCIDFDWSNHSLFVIVIAVVGIRHLTAFLSEFRREPIWDDDTLQGIGLDRQLSQVYCSHQRSLNL